MDTGFPLVMLTLPLVAAAVGVVLRSRRRATAVAGVVTAALLTLLLWLAAPEEGLFADNSATFYGREIVLTPYIRSLFLFIYPAFGLLAATSWFRPLGRMVVPSGLAALSPLAAALMVSPMAFGVVWLVVTAAVLTPALYSGRYEAASSTWRYFLLTALSVVPLLLTASPPSGGWNMPWLASLLAVRVVLGGFPFHLWVAELGRRSSPAALALVLGLAQIVPVVFVFSLLDTVPAARAAVEFQTAVRWSAALTALLAVFQMSRSRDWRGIVTGATLLDMGFLLAAALAPGADGLIIAVPALINRYLSLLMLVLGGESERAADNDSRIGRFGRRLRPLLFAYGLFSLIGLPLTPGFAARWAQVSVVGQASGIWPSILLVASLLAAAWIAARSIGRSREGQEEQPGGRSEGETVFAAIMFGVLVLLGWLPHLLSEYAARMLGIL